MSEVAETVAEEPARRRERSGGRSARRELRSHGPQGIGRPYIVRGIPTYDILSEESLQRIENDGGPHPCRDRHRVPRRCRWRSTTGGGPAPPSTASW